MPSTKTAAPGARNRGAKPPSPAPRGRAAGPPIPQDRSSPGLASAAPAEDHRVRTGALRREQTRRKLLASAMGVFAEKGVDAPLIDDFIAAAGVARGTFYNYFRTTQELLSAVTSELSDQVIDAIEVVVERIPDPLERLGTACLIYMHMGTTVPHWGAFLMRTGLHSASLGKLVDAYMPRDLAAAKKAKEVDFPTLRAARDLMIATMNQAILTVLAGEAPARHLRQMLWLALRGLGVPAQRATELSEGPVPTVDLPDWLELGAKKG